MKKSKLDFFVSRSTPMVRWFGCDDAASGIRRVCVTFLLLSSSLHSQATGFVFDNCFVRLGSIKQKNRHFDSFQPRVEQCQRCGRGAHKMNRDIRLQSGGDVKAHSKRRE